MGMTTQTTVLTLSTFSTISSALVAYAQQMGFGGYVPTQAWTFEGGEALVYVDDRGRVWVALRIKGRNVLHEARGVARALEWEGMQAA